jgi:glucokinase
VFLCCDLGGTNADWAVYDTRSKELLLRTKMALQDYDDFYEMLDHFLSRVTQLSPELKIRSATVACAGRVDEGSARLTNVEGWALRNEMVSGILGDHGHSPRVNLINDFEALSSGASAMLSSDQKTDALEIHGRFKKSPPRVGERRRTRSLICGPGTGLGVACLIEGETSEESMQVVSSEGGHHSFAPESIDQQRFHNFFSKSSSKTSYEDALSKQGLKNIYNFYRREDYSSEMNFSILARDIVSLAESGKDQAAADSVSLFCEILANFCGNLALTFNIDKTIFLWGDVLLKLNPDLLKSRFKQHYPDRCMHSDRIQDVPVVLIRNEDIPLHGCAIKSGYGTI